MPAAAPSSLRVSVVTPTYNRAHTLHRVYESLVGQTLRGTPDAPLFEWIVIDDGSADDTRELVAEYAREAPFPVRYHFQENQGKAAALNAGFDLARGELLLMADSDDRFVPETMETFLRYWDSDLRKSYGDEIVSILCQVRDGNTGELISDVPADAPVVSEPNFLEFQYRRRYFGEGWSIGRTEVMRSYRFPQIEGVKFIPEAYVWNDIARRTKSLIVSDVLRIALFEKDGYTRNPVLGLIRQPIGPAMYYLKNLNDNAGLMLRYNPIQFVKHHLQLARMNAHARIPFGRVWGAARPWYNRLLAAALYLPGRMVALIDRRRFGAELRGASGVAS